ncbi:hypothetical protein QZH41_004193 [Actinostola sp. cb2023]|nr:hypothetical protein QZH41_004193 [Actinostola sp. cb2023]
MYSNIRSRQQTDHNIVLYDSKIARNGTKNMSNAIFPKLYSTDIDENKFDENCDDSSIKEIEVIEIPDDCDLKDGDETSEAKQDSLRQRKVTKKYYKSSSSLPSFSDDDDELEISRKQVADDKCDGDDELEVSRKQVANDKCEDVMPPDKTSNKTKHLSITALGVMIMSVAVVVVSLYVHLNPHGLCLSSEFRYNLTGLKNDLKQEFYGQHLAMKILLSSLKSHSQTTKRNKPLVLSLHGWTGTGKNYVSGLIAKHIFKHGINSKFIHKFIIPLHFPHVSEIDVYKRQLKDWIIGNITKCSKGGLFIFDEMDKIPPGVVDVLKPFLDTKGAKFNLDFRKVIFLFLSNTGGKLINQHVLEHYKKGLARESVGLVELEHLLDKHTDNNPNVWYKELLESEDIDYFVPFLPLERSHLKQCIRKDMQSKGYVILERMVTEVADEMGYFPQDLQIFSVAGCKKVSSKVDVAMG